MATKKGWTALGVVLRTPPEHVNVIVDALRGDPLVHVVYIRTSDGYLTVIEGVPLND